MQWNLQTMVSGLRSGLWALLFPVGGLQLNRRMQIPHFKGLNKLNKKTFDRGALLSWYQSRLRYFPAVLCGPSPTRDKEMSF